MILLRSEAEKYPIIGEGGQGKIHQIDENTVIKLTDANEVDLLYKMISISLNQFLKPKDAVYENGVCYAFAYPLLNKTDNKSILLLLKEKLISNIDILTQEIKQISENRILIHDLIPNNSACIDEIIYIFDFNLYTFAPMDLTEEQIFKINIQRLEQYFHKLWIMALVKLGLNRSSLKYHPEYFCESYIKTIQDKMREEENIKEYVKRSIQ